MHFPPPRLILAVGVLATLVAALTVAILPADPSQAEAPAEATAVLVTASGNGSLVVGADGSITTVGDATSAGSLDDVPLSRELVDAASTSSGSGYWLAAADGGIFAFGDAGYHGSTGDIALNEPIVGIAATPSDQGYLLAASDGGVFTFGDAAFAGSMGGHHLNQPIVGMARTPSGDGYWLVAADGGIFAFGDAPFLGSTGDIDLNQPIVGMAASDSGAGYWLVAEDGGIFSFGDAPYVGTPTPGDYVVDIAATPAGGYRVTDRTGATWTYTPGQEPQSSPSVLSPPPRQAAASPSAGDRSAMSAGAATPASGDVFVSATGSGRGTQASPAGLAAALTGGVRVDPGDTIWLRGGTYRGAWTVRVGGTDSAPVTIRSYPGEWARLDGASSGAVHVLDVQAHRVVVRDLEVLVSSTNRNGSRPSGILVGGDYVKVVNTVVHDTGNGIQTFSEAWATELYGNVIYNTGSMSPEYGHNIYVANVAGSNKVIENNVWFGTPTTRFGLHAYASNGGITGITVRGNVGMENLLGGPAPVDGLTLEDNDFNYLRLGYQWGAANNGSAVVRNNRFGFPGEASTDRPLNLSRNWGSVTMTGNTVTGNQAQAVRLADGGSRPIASPNWDQNRYFQTQFAAPGFAGDINGWRSFTGFDRSSSWSGSLPGDSVAIRPNRYESGRALVVAYNWSGRGTVSFDPSSFLARGARYVVQNAFDMTAAPAASGTWNGGSISVSTNQRQAQPIGGGYQNPAITPGMTVLIVRTA